MERERRNERLRNVRAFLSRLLPDDEAERLYRANQRAAWLLPLALAEVAAHYSGPPRRLNGGNDNEPR